MDPQTNEEGKPLAPLLYRDILRRCYYISKNTNNSIEEVKNMPVYDRDMIIEFMINDAKQLEKVQKEQQRQRNSKRR